MTKQSHLFAWHQCLVRLWLGQSFMMEPEAPPSSSAQLQCGGDWAPHPGCKELGELGLDDDIILEVAEAMATGACQ